MLPNSNGASTLAEDLEKGKSLETSDLTVTSVNRAAKADQTSCSDAVENLQAKFRNGTYFPILPPLPPEEGCVNLSAAMNGRYYSNVVNTYKFIVDCAIKDYEILNKLYADKKKNIIVPFYKSNVIVSAQIIRPWAAIPAEELEKLKKTYKAYSYPPRYFVKSCSYSEAYIIFGNVKAGDIIYVCIDLETASLLFGLTGGNPVVMVGSANNLCKVAKSLRLVYQQNEICFVADFNDQSNYAHTAGGEGVKYAFKGAYSIDNASIVVPYHPDIPDFRGSFYDLFSRIKSKEFLQDILINRRLPSWFAPTGDFLIKDIGIINKFFDLKSGIYYPAASDKKGLDNLGAVLDNLSSCNELEFNCVVEKLKDICESLNSRSIDIFDVIHSLNDVINLNKNLTLEIAQKDIFYPLFWILISDTRNSGALRTDDIVLPKFYFLNYNGIDGLFYIENDEKNKKFRFFHLGPAIKFVGKAVSNASVGNENRDYEIILECYNKGELDRFSIPTKFLYRYIDLLDTLSCHGWTPNNPGSHIEIRLIQNYLGASTNLNDNLYISVSRMGLHRAKDKDGKTLYVFARPDKLYFSNDSDFCDRFIISSRKKSNNIFIHEGDLEYWKKTIATYAIGNYRLMFCLSLAFSSMIIGFYPGYETGGFHLYGASSVGKTTLLSAVGTVFGQYGLRCEIAGYVESWNNTKNNLENVLYNFTDSLLCLDELSLAEKGNLASTIYMFSSGRTKGRMNEKYDSENINSWRLSILSTGEKSILAKVLEDGENGNAGILVRMVDLPIFANSALFEDLHGYPNLSSFASAIDFNGRISYGNAGVEFIENMMRNVDDLASNTVYRVSEIFKLLKPKEIDNQFSRILQRVSLAVYGGLLAVKYNIVPWTYTDVFDSARRCVNDIINNMEGVRGFEYRKVINVLLGFISSHIRDIISYDNLHKYEEITYRSEIYGFCKFVPFPDDGDFNIDDSLLVEWMRKRVVYYNSKSSNGRKLNQFFIYYLVKEKFEKCFNNAGIEYKLALPYLKEKFIIFYNEKEKRYSAKFPRWVPLGLDHKPCYIIALNSDFEEDEKEDNILSNPVDLENILSKLLNSSINKEVKADDGNFHDDKNNNNVAFHDNGTDDTEDVSTDNRKN